MSNRINRRRPKALLEHDDTSIADLSNSVVRTWLDLSDLKFVDVEDASEADSTEPCLDEGVLFRPRLRFIED
jgi:hypothetical protein